MKISPCPFCLSADVVITEQRGLRRAPSFWYIKCLNCRTRGPVFLETYAAAEAWNRWETVKDLRGKDGDRGKENAAKPHQT